MKDFFIFGKAIAVAEMIGCDEVNDFYLKRAFIDKDDTISENCIAWAFSKVQPVVPFDVKGQQGLFNVDEANIKYLPFDVSTDEGAIDSKDDGLKTGTQKKCHGINVHGIYSIFSIPLFTCFPRKRE